MNTLHQKRMLARLWSLSPKVSPRRVILYYHAVGQGPDALPASVFRQQMEWLATHGDVLSLDDFISEKGNKKSCFSISFDDGYASVFEDAFPILRSLNLPAMVYVNTGWIGHQDRIASNSSLGHYPGEFFMSWDEVRTLAENGWVIGSHGVDHLDLTAVDDEQLFYELAHSKKTIERHLKNECKHFAFTWGRYSRKVQDAVKRAGYQTAASAIHGPLQYSSDLFAMPRIDISTQYSFDDFKAIVRGNWDFLGKIQSIRRYTDGYARL